MENKGFADNQANTETPSDVGITEKPLKTHLKASNRVDINVLKSKLQETESKENKKKYFYFCIINFSSRMFRHLLFNVDKFANIQIS